MSPGVVTIEDMLRPAARALGEAGIEDARAEARLLLAHVLGLPREALLRDSRQAIERGAAQRFEALIARRARREPIAYLTGFREFWSLGFEVAPATLVPRPESETLVEAALDQLRPRDDAYRVLDLGTGTGCLLLALLSELPAATGVGVDLSDQALDIARRNACRLGFADRATFVRGSWGAGLDERFDLIVTNPPYVAEAEAGALPPDVAAYEPAGALFGGPDGLESYRALAPDLARLLAPGGLAVVELGAGAAAAVATILSGVGLAERERRPDLAGIERCGLWNRR